MHGKNAMMRSSLAILSHKLTPPHECFFYLGEQVYLVVRLAEVVLYVVVFGWDAQLDELVLERSALLEKAVNLAVYLHSPFVSSLSLLISAFSTVMML